MTMVILDLGTNIDREASLVSALEKLAEHFQLIKTSSVYKTVPVGMANQPDFFNLALEISTDKSVEEIRTIATEIEDDMGRDRSGPRFGPRNIDIDIVLYGDVVDPDSELPHPQASSELFVVGPLAELRPDGIDPVSGETWKSIRGELMGGRSAKDAGIEKVFEVTALPLGDKAKAALGAALK